MAPRVFFTFLHLQLLLLFFSPSTVTCRTQQQPKVHLKYHNGALLKGTYDVNVVMYGTFSESQRSVILDFLASLTPPPGAAAPPPSVSSWWNTTHAYRGGSITNFTSGELLRIYGLSPSEKHLNASQLMSFFDASKGDPSSLYVVLTGEEVTVDGFCTSRCGFHVPMYKPNAERAGNFIWVGNSRKQCPGMCAWPFHKPIYGPKNAPALIPPNGDVGIDGMLINLATLLAGVATNPYGDGYYQGPKDAPLEAVSACAGIFGSGAYPGYPGKLLVDETTGASYNARGINGRKYLLPAMWDPKTSRCSTLV